MPEPPDEFGWPVSALEDAPAPWFAEEMLTSDLSMEGSIGADPKLCVEGKSYARVDGKS